MKITNEVSTAEKVVETTSLSPKIKILAIETSSTACSLALLIDNQLITRHLLAPMQQAKIILSEINELLREAQITFNQLNAIAFGCGPGSFTGVRIATSVAQGLGYASSIPLIPISSLASLAQSAYEDLGWKKLLVAVDARMQEIYLGIYIANDQGIVQLQDKECLCSAKDVPIVEAKDIHGVGDGWLAYKDQFTWMPFKVDTERLPTAAGVVRLAKIKYQNNQMVSADQAEPVYLRNQVASKKKTKKEE